MRCLSVCYSRKGTEFNKGTQRSIPLLTTCQGRVSSFSHYSPRRCAFSNNQICVGISGICWDVTYNISYLLIILWFIKFPSFSLQFCFNSLSTYLQMIFMWFFFSFLSLVFHVPSYPFTSIAKHALNAFWNKSEEGLRRGQLKHGFNYFTFPFVLKCFEVLKVLILEWLNVKWTEYAFWI